MLQVRVSSHLTATKWRLNAGTWCVVKCDPQPEGRTMKNINKINDKGGK